MYVCVNTPLSGHCGVLCGHEVENDQTLELLAKTALSHVQAGADMVAPSDMMDGRVRAIRSILDQNGHKEIPIMSYAVKYASAFYGEFRDAAGSAPSFGDRKSYQMDFHNRREGIKEALLDVEEGADIIMIKPAMSYLDMVREVKDRIQLPVATYSVSGEYAMVKAGAKLGYIEEDRIICEMAVSAYRAEQIFISPILLRKLPDLFRKGESDNDKIRRIISKSSKKNSGRSEQSGARLWICGGGAPFYSGGSGQQNF